jgi:hypothetical protein
MSKTKKVAWFKFEPTKETSFAITLGTIAILLSIWMGMAHSNFWRMFLRSVCQMGITGVILPIWFLYKKGELYQAGIKWEKPVKMFLISILLGSLLSLVFIKNGGGQVNNIFGASYIQATIYVMIANVFEVVFFFAFMTYYFEKAFGVISAIILSSIFYSFHHAGFEPAFLELFIVGMVFISIFRIAHNALICFPLWWVGGLGDVLVSKSNQIDRARMNLAGISPVIACFAIVIGMIVWNEQKKNE